MHSDCSLEHGGGSLLREFVCLVVDDEETRTLRNFFGVMDSGAQQDKINPMATLNQPSCQPEHRPLCATAGEISNNQGDVHDAIWCFECRVGDCLPVRAVCRSRFVPLAVVGTALFCGHIPHRSNKNRDSPRRLSHGLTSAEERPSGSGKRAYRPSGSVLRERSSSSAACKYLAGHISEASIFSRPASATRRSHRPLLWSPGSTLP